MADMKHDGLDMGSDDVILTLESKDHKLFKISNVGQYYQESERTKLINNMSL